MIKYFSKKELMNYWIEEQLKISLHSAFIDNIEEKTSELPEESFLDIKKKLDIIKENPSEIFDTTELTESDISSEIDYDSKGFKSFDLFLSEMKKRWISNEDKFIKEIQADYKKRGITILLKD